MARLNQCINPSCANDVTGWLDSVPTRVTGLSGPPKTTGGQLAIPAGAFSASLAVGSAASSALNVPWSIVCWVRFSVTRSFQVLLSHYQSGAFVNTQGPGVTQSFTANTWTEVKFTGNSLASGTFNTVCVHFDFPTAGTAGTLTVSSVRMEQITDTLTYTDGDSAGWAWTGTAGNSTSTSVDPKRLFLPF